MSELRPWGGNPHGFFFGSVNLKIRPSFTEFKNLARQGNFIPVCHTFLADTETPVSAYLKIRDNSFSYLLESADMAERWGRYSFLGYRPYLMASIHKQKMEIRENGRKKILNRVKNPLTVLRNLMKAFEPVALENLAPFQGGFVGYFNYDLIRKWEHLPGISAEKTEMPESLFMLARRLIIFDHLTHQINVLAFAYLKHNRDLKTAYDQTCQEIEETLNEIKGPLPDVSEKERLSLSALTSNFKQSDFESAVSKAKDYIVAGDVIQVVLSQKFSGDIRGDDFLLYRNLRSVNPSPYMFYLNYDKVKLIGSSPEILVRLTDGKIVLRPIAGTRPRGKTPQEDQALEKELLADPKERAEHVMLVDLGRNDVGKPALPGTVEVPRFMEVERYSHVMHIVSSVEGRLQPELDAYDVFMSSFPAGTVTGAPKVRAMEIISELEPTDRGPYAGAVGYFSFSGNMDFCITIRTITVVNGKLSIQVGAGIVADSVPEKEYDETLRKAAAMFKAIERAGVK